MTYSIAYMTIQGEFKTHNVVVNYRTIESFRVIDNGTGIPQYVADPDNNKIEITHVGGDLPSNFEDQRIEYELEILSKL